MIVGLDKRDVLTRMSDSCASKTVITFLGINRV